MASLKYFRLLSKRSVCVICALLAVLMIFVNFKGFIQKQDTTANVFSHRRVAVKHVKNNTRSVLNRSTQREIILTPDNAVLNIVIILKNTKRNPNLQARFETLIKSVYMKSSVLLSFHVICDTDGGKVATSTIRRFAPKETKIVIYNVTEMTQKVGEQITQMQAHFSNGANAYYGDPLFFLSMVLHRVLQLDKVIMLDVDLKFDEDIRHLYEIFSLFSERNIIGIARENQPVYRHLFHQYRGKNPSTRVGAPPPSGLTGFNSGVLLLNLEKMRLSNAYNSLIDSSKTLERLKQKYSFQGHLGDQDFYTLTCLENEELYFVLPCSWNWQLCVWWRDHGYSQVFDQYYICSEKIKIYHGNCNSNIPTLSWETETKKFPQR